MSEMTLSQALRHSKKLKGKIAELTARATQSVSYKASTPPAFKFSSVMESLESSKAELVGLETRIALTNARTVVDADGRKMSVIEAVRRLQELKSAIGFLKSLPVRSHEDTKESEREYGSPVAIDTPWKCDMPEASRALKVDEVQSVFDRINDAVERINHVTRLEPLA